RKQRRSIAGPYRDRYRILTSQKTILLRALLPLLRSGQWHQFRNCDVRAWQPKTELLQIRVLRLGFPSLRAEQLGFVRRYLEAWTLFWRLLINLGKRSEEHTSELQSRGHLV